LLTLHLTSIDFLAYSIHMNDWVIHGNVVTEDGVLESAFISIENGIITNISSEGGKAKQIIDVTGSYVLPGGIDTHVHSHSSSYKPEGWQRVSQCAAKGGVTTIVDMPYDSPEPTTTPEILKQKIKALEQDSIIDVALYGTMRKHGGISQLMPLVEAGVSAFKFSTYETDPERFPKISNSDIVKAFEVLQHTNLPVCFHAEDGDIVDPLVKELYARGEAEPHLHATSRPPISEMTSVASLLELVRNTKVKLHIVHLTIPEGFDLLEHYRSLGVDVTAETCIHYLLLDDSEFDKQRGFVKCNPPLRTKAMLEGLWQKLFEGRIDFITTDHAPWASKLKDKPNIFDNKSGLPGLETLLPLLYHEGVSKRGLSIEKFSKLISTNPAKRFNFYPHKGVLKVGSDADITILDPRASFLVKSEDTYSVVAHTPYDGWTLNGRITHTFVRGQLVYDGEKTLEHQGRFIKPS
jgi:allantoinase